MLSIETKSYCLSGFTEEQQNHCKEYRLSQKGKLLWAQIYNLNCFARNLCSTYDESYRFNESSGCRRYKHLPFQCDYNDNEILASYAKGNYDFDNLEQIEEFVVFKGAYEIAGYIQNDDAPCKTENYAIYWVIAWNIIMIILISLNSLRKFILQNNLLPFRDLWKKKLLNLKPH